MEVFLEDITDEMAASDGGPPPRTAAATVPALSGDPPPGKSQPSVSSVSSPSIMTVIYSADMIVWSARGGHTATRIKGAVYVYGGATRDVKYCDQVFRLCIDSMSWELVQVRSFDFDSERIKMCLCNSFKCQLTAGCRQRAHGTKRPFGRGVEGRRHPDFRWYEYGPRNVL